MSIALVPRLQQTLQLLHETEYARHLQRSGREFHALFRQMAKTGNEAVNTANAGWTLILAPVYLFFRDKRLGFPQWRLVAMLTGLVGGGVLSSSGGLSNFTAELTGTLPACSASNVSDTVRSTFNQIAQLAAST